MKEKLEVVDKDTGKVVWIERFDNLDALERAKKQLKENNFNPDFFSYYVNGDRDE